MELSPSIDAEAPSRACARAAQSTVSWLREEREGTKSKVRSLTAKGDGGTAADGTPMPRPPCCSRCFRAVTQCVIS